jgi:hypothetical protein
VRFIKSVDSDKSQSLDQAEFLKAFAKLKVENAGDLSGTLTEWSEAIAAMKK